MKLGSNSIYLCTIIDEGHAAFSVDPYLGYVLKPHTTGEGGQDSRMESACDVLYLGHPLLGCLWLGCFDLRGLGSLLQHNPLLLV